MPETKIPSVAYTQLFLSCLPCVGVVRGTCQKRNPLFINRGVGNSYLAL